MRFLSALLLLLACSTVNAEAILCSNGMAYGDGSATDCPVNSTNESILDIGQTTATITGTADSLAAGSTVYHWTGATNFPQGCTSLNYTYAHLSDPVLSTRQAAELARQKCMLWPNIVAGSGSPTSFSSAAISAAGVYTLQITGLTAGSTYYTQHFIKGGVGGSHKVGKLSTQVFTTNSSGGAPGEQPVDDRGTETSRPSPRFVGGGSNMNTGLSHAQRWASLSTIACNLLPGTNVGIFNTTLYEQSLGNLDICYSSSSTDWAIIGGYKLGTGSVPIWIRDDVRGSGTTDQKPELRGGLTDACLAAVTCDFSTAAIASMGLPNGQYDVPVTVQGSYIELRNIKLSYWHGNFLHAYGNYNHFIAEGIDIYKSGAGGYAITDGYRDSVWRNGDSQYLGLCIQMRQSGLPSAKYMDACPPGTLYATGVLSRTLNGRHLYENNDVAYGVSETWDCIQGSSHVIMRGNRSYGMSSAGWYADGCSDYVAENNISIGSSNQGYSGAGTTGAGPGQQGMCIADIEFWQGNSSRSPTNYMCRNNLFLRTGGCMGASLSNEAVALGRTVGMWFYGNTCLATEYIDVQNWPIPAANIQRTHAKSNVIYSLSEREASFGVGGAQNVWSHNHVQAAFSDGDLNGSNQTTGDPNLVTSYAAFDSNTYNPSNWPTFALARPNVGNTNLIDTGVQLEAVVLTWADFGFAATEMADFKSGAITSTHWVKERYYCSGSLNEVCGATPPKGVSCPAAGC